MLSPSEIAESIIPTVLAQVDSHIDQSLSTLQRDITDKFNHSLEDTIKHLDARIAALQQEFQTQVSSKVTESLSSTLECDPTPESIRSALIGDTKKRPATDAPPSEPPAKLPKLKDAQEFNLPPPGSILASPARAPTLKELRANPLTLSSRTSAPKSSTTAQPRSSPSRVLYVFSNKFSPRGTSNYPDHGVVASHLRTYGLTNLIQTRPDGRFIGPWIIRYACAVFAIPFTPNAPEVSVNRRVPEGGLFTSDWLRNSMDTEGYISFTSDPVTAPPNRDAFHAQMAAFFDCTEDYIKSEIRAVAIYENGSRTPLHQLTVQVPIELAQSMPTYTQGNGSIPLYCRSVHPTLVEKSALLKAPRRLMLREEDPLRVFPFGILQEVIPTAVTALPLMHYVYRAPADVSATADAESFGAILVVFGSVSDKVAATLSPISIPAENGSTIIFEWLPFAHHTMNLASDR
jgi:hypothetical protein